MGIVKGLLKFIAVIVVGVVCLFAVILSIEVAAAPPKPVPLSEAFTGIKSAELPPPAPAEPSPPVEAPQEAPVPEDLIPEPAPEPAPAPAPAPVIPVTPDEPPVPPAPDSGSPEVNTKVHPGGFCTGHEGETGVADNGATYVCADRGKGPHWSKP